jgi:hypothetical protein
VPGETKNLGWLLFIALFIAVGGASFVFGVRGLRRKLKLFGKGIATLGKNLGIRFDHTMQVNNEPSRYLQFEFIDFQGNTHNGNSSYLNEKQIQLLQNMINVPIVYLPDAPDTADLDFERIEERQLSA